MLPGDDEEKSYRDASFSSPSLTNFDHPLSPPRSAEHGETYVSDGAPGVEPMRTLRPLPVNTAPRKADREETESDHVATAPPAHESNSGSSSVVSRDRQIGPSSTSGLKLVKATQQSWSILLHGAAVIVRLTNLLFNRSRRLTSSTLHFYVVQVYPPLGHVGAVLNKHCL